LEAACSAIADLVGGGLGKPQLARGLFRGGMPKGSVLGVGIGSSVMLPSIVTRPSFLALPSVNHIASLYCQAVISHGWLLGVGIGYSRT
jgi:hypothetical protein